ncbi:hypothetical protein NLJ89_g10995 [Agrocybe chaxingu]|uniref:WW domain-containing protein n=1 Tax=Agrocybe chaxingu TaxID=84603 RepID=A0A9W8JX44_9AGAR|nr:hypothetical protein NLJ89_g10995 [Agrocybe chaxingu]
MQTARNPDTRPLPEGWIQHYESSKQLWYYVQTTVMPPKVSFTHPLDLERLSKRMHIATPQAERPMSVVRQPHPLPPVPQGLTTAQKLYASSGSNISTPMISSDIQNLSTAPESHPPSRVSMLPTPPPSNSPPAGRRSSFVLSPSSGPPRQSVSVSNRPANQTDYRQSMAPHAVAGSRISRYAANSSIAYASPSSVDSSSHPKSMTLSSGSHTPHRTQSLQIPPPPPHFPGRTNTYSTGQVTYISSKPPSVSPRPTPHLTTTARPPANLQVPGHNHLTPPQTASLGSPPSSNHSLSPLSLPSNSPPSSSVLFSQPAPGPSSAPPGTTAFATPPISPPPAPLSPTLSSPISNNSTITPENFHKYSKMGQLGSQAYKIAGGVLAGSTGLPLGVLPDPVKLINSLKAAFSKNNNMVAESDLQAVAHAKPGANYQAIISALVRQQQQYQQQLASQLQLQTAMGMQYQRPPQPAVDYHALIAEIQQLQIAAQTQQASALLAQQQTFSQLHMSAQQHQQHQQAMEALKVQQAAILQQQSVAAQHAQQQVAARLQTIQQRQATAAAQLQLQLQQQEQQQTYAQKLQAQLQLQQQQAIAQQQAMLNAAIGSQLPQRPPAGHQQSQNPSPLQDVFSSIYGSINQQQQQQNPPPQSGLSSIYETINTVQQPQNLPPSQSGVTTLLEMYGNMQQQIHQQQQQSMVDMMNAMSLGGSGTPLFGGTDPVGATAIASGGSASFLNAVTQTINGATSSDPTGGVAAINSISQLSSGATAGVDPSSFTAGLELGLLGDTIGSAFSS